MKTILMKISAIAALTLGMASIANAGRMQTAELNAGGTIILVEVNAFPNQPEIIVHKQQIFIHDKPDFGFGNKTLHYHLPSSVVVID